MSRTTVDAERLALQEQIIAFIRAFGLHRPGETPCGRPVSVSEAPALMKLTPDDLRPQVALAEPLRLEKSTVTPLVSQLEARGWLERARDPGDGRALRVTLTAKGRSVARELAAARQAKFESLLARIPDEERESVQHALGILVEALHDEA